MTKSATYSLWLEPTGNVAFKLQEMIKALSKKYDTPVFTPHVTVVGGLKASKAELVPLVDTLASSITPFTIKLSKAGYLNTFYQALFIHVEENEDLSNLHKKACHFFDCPDKYKNNYMPHLSLLYGELSKKEKERILNNIGREMYLQFDAQKMVLMKTSGKPHQWQKVHTAMFKPA